MGSAGAMRRIRRPRKACRRTVSQPVAVPSTAPRIPSPTTSLQKFRRSGWTVEARAPPPRPRRRRPFFHAKQGRREQHQASRQDRQTTITMLDALPPAWTERGDQRRLREGEAVHRRGVVTGGFLARGVGMAAGLTSSRFGHQFGGLLVSRLGQTCSTADLQAVKLPQLLRIGLSPNPVSGVFVVGRRRSPLGL